MEIQTRAPQTNMSVSITHNKTGNVKTFSHPRDAQAWVEKWLAQKFKMEELTIENNSGVALTAYQSRIPEPVQELIERMELDHGGNIVPLWHWMWKEDKTWSTGRSSYTRIGHKNIRIAISANSNPYDYIGVVVHEFAHSLTVGEHHGRAFYRKLFQMLETYVGAAIREQTVKREWRYMTSSRYWYAEMYNRRDILAEYRPVRVAATRLTKEQQTQLVADLMFADLESE